MKNIPENNHKFNSLGCRRGSLRGPVRSRPRADDWLRPFRMAKVQFDYPVMFPRPEITDQVHMMAVRFVQDAVIRAQRATLQLQANLGLIEQVPRRVSFAL